jgi:hypothetical protein
MECRCFELIAEFTQRLNFAKLEKALIQECAKLCAEMLQALLQDLLNDTVFLALLKIYAGKKGQRFKEYREITVSLSNGQRITISSPYFCKARKHHKRKKRGPNGSGAHHGLAVLGFIGQVSPGLLADALQTSLRVHSNNMTQKNNSTQNQRVKTFKGCAGTIFKNCNHLNLHQINFACHIFGMHPLTAVPVL